MSNEICGVSNPGGLPCSKEKGHLEGHDESAYGPLPVSGESTEAETGKCPHSSWRSHEWLECKDCGLIAGDVPTADLETKLREAQDVIDAATEILYHCEPGWTITRLCQLLPKDSASRLREKGAIR